MWNPNPMSLWVWATGADAGTPTPPVVDAGSPGDDCGIARIPVHGVTFAVAHSPTCRPRHMNAFFRALAWLFGPFVERSETEYAR